MTDSETHFCAICGVPAETFVTQGFENQGSADDVPRDSARGERRYYCKKHLPHLHAERLEDRIE
jgi:hypothetical protein